MDLVTLAEVEKAAQSIAGVAVRTPVLPAPWAGGDLWLKPETLQPVGSFKLRGAFHAVSILPEAQRARGILAYSSGNHAQAVAYAARAFGVPCIVVMPDNAAAVKVERTRALGAELVLGPAAERERIAADVLATRGDLALVPPFDHPAVIAGQGTIGLELLADLPDLDRVLVPVGGGGLASGVATAIKALRPSVVVLGVEPALAAETAEGLALGRRTSWPVERTHRTIADGVRTGPSDLTFAHLRERLDGIVTVEEAEIVAAVRELATAARLVVEPSGALTVAAYRRYREQWPGRTAAVLSGGNVDPAVLAGILTGRLTG
jgi:threonine dehydratase